MATITVKQVRSQINCPQDQKRTLVALGLKRLGQSKDHQDSPQIKGMINKVQHLVSVETK
jgi:large subunit ribosomal protein L30